MLGMLPINSTLYPVSTAGNFLPKKILYQLFLNQFIISFKTNSLAIERTLFLTSNFYIVTTARKG